MLKITMEEELPGTLEELKEIVDLEIPVLNDYLAGRGEQPVSDFEWRMVRTYLLAKLEDSG